ncbi:C2 domain-containing protein 3-like isoform X2 [Babylonia areolata]|uniref:C2 domain-containing protein 3-like isoform X2 n=1 Tax=Babylonia areolata TaxID=304850 RepID=UPI003FD0070B
MKKKGNPTKSTNKRGGESKRNEDVQVKTGLPPQVNGQLRCFCKVSINEVLWSRASPPSTIVRVKWWGEEGGGALFRPRDVKKGNKGTTCTTGRYPVRSGPKQFASYLGDMEMLTVDLFTSETAKEPVGHAHITQIAHLSNNRPINGFFPILSRKNDKTGGGGEKIGELQVSVMLEPLMDSYDNTGSIPTTDLPAHPPQPQDPTLPSASRPQPHSHQPVKPQEDPFISPASHLTEDIRLQNNARTHNAADLRQRLQYDLGDGGHGHSYPVAITTSGDVVGISDIHGSGVPLVGGIEEAHVPPSLQRPAGYRQGQGENTHSVGQGGDIVSMMLSRGIRLRKAMVASSLNSNEHNNNNTSLDLTPSSPAGAVEGAVGGVGAMYSPGPDVKVDSLLDDKSNDPVSMLLGSPVGKHEWQMLQMLNGGSPGPSVCSEGMDVLSEPGDPLHDHTLLQELFYKRLDSEMSELSGVSGDEDGQRGVLKNPGNMRPPSRSSSFSSLAAAMPTSPPPSPSQKRKRKSKAKSSSDPSKNARRSRSRSRERNPRMTETVVPKKSKSRSRSRSGSRSKSRSLSRKRKGSVSDSDIASTPRSEASRVSFDPVPSDVEDNFDQNPREKQVDGLSVERLTLLGRVHVARVSVLNLILHASDLDTSSVSKASARRTGKPPRPTKNRKPCTYLIEYQFPVVATSRDKYSPNAMATEVMRVASKTVSNGVISFNHRSVFPLMFDGAALEKWWKSALVFKVFSREAGQKSPVLLGSCGVSLKSILKSDDLHLTRDLEIRDLSRSTSSNSSARNVSLNSSRSTAGAGYLGSLKVSVELASDHKDFATSLARTRVAEMSANGQNIVPVVPPTPPAVPPLSLPPSAASPVRQVETGYPNARPPSPAKLPQPPPGYSSSNPSKTQQSSVPAIPSSVIHEYSQLQKPVFHNSDAAAAQSSQQEVLPLHTLIVVPEGCNISLHGVPPLHMVSRNPALLQQQLQHGSSGRDQMTRNTYLVCRMFWSNDSVHSNVCWGTLNPQYNFSQVAPVLVTGSLLERMRNNCMVIEVWDKKTTAENDKLIGICKLSLHQFYMSFRDAKISAALLRSEYPVVAIDNYMPVVDPFTGMHFGQLSVLLAMGSAQQVACLQRLKSDRESGTVTTKAQRPSHFLERQDVYGPDLNPVRLDSSGSSVEHSFEVVVQGVRGLKLLDTMIWGEADCFVQYFFPSQGQAKQQGPTLVLAMPSLRSFRTATTLCIPDPTFSDVTRHRITLPVATPVQRELLTACANSSAGSGGLPFEVWCRFYHPNVRDQVIARATLPLAKLCAMVTMQKRGEPSVQSFSLPLTPVASGSQDQESQAKMKDSGLMDVTVHYKTQTVQTGDSGSGSVRQMTGGSQVSLCISVIRASGLQAAAEWAARTDSGMQYPAEVGVNSYIRLILSFLGSQEERVTKTVARTFSPEFSHHVELPLQLMWSGDQDDPASLAQVLETGHLSLQVWHQVPTSSSPGVVEYECDDRTGGKRLVQTSGDVLLGTCTIPLAHLLIRQAGIKGWFSMDRPTSTWAHADSNTSTSEEGPSSSSSSSSRLVGGVEVGVHFAHSSDRQKVVESARSVGWSPIDPTVELDSWQDEDAGGQQESHQVSMKVDQVCVPLARVLLPGQTSLDPSARCYIRYKFYDRAAVVSRSSRLHGDGERLQAGVQHRHTMVLPHSAPFLWYLREERLEVQVWVTFGSHDKGQRPLQRDKLVGTAYVDLLPLCDTRRRQHRISGLLPLFKPGTPNLAGAFVQLHLTSNLCRGNQLLDDEDEVIEEGERSDFDYDSGDSFHQLVGSGHSPAKSKSASKEVDVGPVFTVHLSVERALHLPTVRASGRTGEVAPTTYVSFQSAERALPTYSDIVANSTDPVWDYTAEVALSADLLTHNSKNLVLKVWHKPEGGSKQPDKSCDRVLGFVSVDLCPLNSGLRQICGWYNIVDLSGQSRGQIKVSIIPVEQGGPASSNAATGGPSVSMLSSRGGSVCVTSEPVAGFSFFPTSLPALSSLPTMAGITTAATNSIDGQAGPSSLGGAASHWQPRFLSLPGDGAAAWAGDSSKSMLFSSLRQQLRDLDGLTQRIRLRLSVEESDIDANQPTSARSADILTGTHSGLSTINTTSSLTATREVLSDVSRQLLTSRDITADSSQQPNRSASEDSMSHNAVDSGAFSGNNTGKSQDGPDSHRSDKQVAFGEGKESAGRLLSALPPSGPPACAVEEQFLEGSPQGALTPRSPRDFSSNSQTSQGFQPVGVVPSDSSGSAVAVTRQQEVPVLTNMVAIGDEVTPRSDAPSDEGKMEDFFQQDYHHHPAAYHSDDDNTDDDEMFGSYHHYRAMLDQAEEDHQQEEEEEEGSNVEIITPRRINDVSGMLRQFAHPSGTLPAVFSPLHQVSAGQVALHTWPGVQSHHEEDNTDKAERDRDESAEEEGSGEEEGEKTLEAEKLPSDRGDMTETQERNSFIDSWLEESRDLAHSSLTQGQSAGLTFPLTGEVSTPSHPPLDLDLPTSEAGEPSETATPQMNGAADLESLPSEDRAPGSMHLLSQVELIDTLTSVNSAARQMQGRAQRREGMHNGDLASEQDAEGLARQAHLLSNVELYSTVSSFHPTSQAHRHLLSNVELTSSASGSSHNPDTPSSRPSRQSSATSAGRRAELEVCAEHSEDEEGSDRAQTLSARSDQVSQFFAPPQQGVVMNGAYDSSEEELNYQYSATARVTSAKPRGAVKGREPCQSITATTEDSGLESGAKSSQDEREALSLLDSTQGHGLSEAATMPEFFLPTDELQASMRALQLATSAAESVPQTIRADGKAQASADLLQRLKKAGTASNKFKATVSARGRKLPTAEEAKRIAKIFSAKPS